MCDTQEWALSTLHASREGAALGELGRWLQTVQPATWGDSPLETIWGHRLHVWGQRLCICGPQNTFSSSRSGITSVPRTGCSLGWCQGNAAQPETIPLVPLGLPSPERRESCCHVFISLIKPNIRF